MSGLESDRERLVRAFAARDQSPAALTQCPEPELLFEAASGTLERDRRFKIVDHVSQCAECSQAWRLAMELGARPSSEIDQSKRAAPTVRSDTVWVPRLALAASTIAAVGLAAYLLVPMPKPEYRQAADLLAPNSLVTARLVRDRFLLRWSPGPPGSTYTLRLSTADLVPLLLKQDLTTAELLVPANVLANVASGQQLLWQVEIRLPDGQRVASDTYVVTLD